MKLSTLALLVSSLFANFAYSASFDCGKASADIEKTICNNPTVSKLDEELGTVFKPLRYSGIFRTVQSEWLIDVRDNCESVQCLEEAYSEQIGFLTRVPGIPKRQEFSLAPLDKEKSYSAYDDLWSHWTLAGFPGDDNSTVRSILSATNASDGLHVIAFEGNYDSKLFCTRGGLYEYVDKYPFDQPRFYPIAEDVCLDTVEKISENDEGKRFAGVIDDAFYYRQKISNNQLRGMTYKLGSKQRPEQTSLLFQQWSNTIEYEKGTILLSPDTGFRDLKIFYPTQGKYEQVTPIVETSQAWNVYTPIWSKSRPIFYFKNADSIWRTNMSTKTLTRIASEDNEGSLASPMPVELNGREALIYLEGSTLNVAISKEQ